MMRKTLWALSLLFVLSGCNDDGGEESGSRYDRMINTTFNIEYSLNYDLPSINYPTTYNQQSEPLTGIPEIPAAALMRFTVEFWEEMPNDPNNPEAGVWYRYYGTKPYYTTSHYPVEGQEDRYVFSADARLSRSKFKVVVLADYVRRSGYAYFSLDPQVSGLAPNISHLRSIFAGTAQQNTLGSGTIPLAYEALSGTKDLDLTVYPDQPNVFMTCDVPVTRALGKFTLIATDYGEYVRSVSPAEFEATKKPLEVKVEYNLAVITDPQDPDDGLATNGFRGVYDALLQTFTGYGQAEMQKPVLAISPDGEELTLTFDYAFADLENSPLKDVVVTIYGPMDIVLRRVMITGLPLERNKETFLRAPFLFKVWENGSDDANPGITIIDTFDDQGTPVVVP